MRILAGLWGLVLCIVAAVDPAEVSTAEHGPWPAVVAGGALLLAAAIWRDDED